LKIVIFETKSHVTLTLTSHDLESHIIVNVSRTYGWTFLPGILGHLSGDDLKIFIFPLLQWELWALIYPDREGANYFL